MKKLTMILIFVLIALLFCGTTLATTEINTMSTNTASELMEIKEETKTELEEYARKYESETYGTTAYILNKIRIYSIPACFVGIAIGALYQYVLGTRRLDTKHKGFGLIMGFVTILVICQILPLIFAIVVRGWRG